jgi:uncharacterized membrane protein YhaH (DUF805 family)
MAIKELTVVMLAAVLHRFRQRLRDYWWLWLLIVVAAVALNEVFDRDVADNKNGHPAGDVLVAIVVVVIVSAIWDFATRKSRIPPRGT